MRLARRSSGGRADAGKPPPGVDLLLQEEKHRGRGRRNSPGGVASRRREPVRGPWLGAPPRRPLHRVQDLHRYGSSCSAVGTRIYVHHGRYFMAVVCRCGMHGRLAADPHIQDLLVDNQRFAAPHVALQHQLISAQHELRAVSLASNKARAEREDKVGATADQTARIEAEVRTVAGARVEVEQVHVDMRVLAGMRTELMDKLRALRKQLGRTKCGQG